MPEITQEFLQSIFSYNPDTGELLWKKHRCKSKVGAEVGYSKNKAPHYKFVRIDKKEYMLHRLIWIYVHGKLPDDKLIFVDGDVCNLKLANLMEATHSQMLQHSKTPKHNTTGVKGLIKFKDKFRCKITLDKKTHSKIFNTVDEAKVWLAETREALHGKYAKC